ncbi:MAG: hypothetical protein NZM31_04860 [Gemmatales bacterium]|nr:hypothetical protein [Gemmatales bacterium]MDW8386328.1 hypothetical protein [Gemmatales bacterium]
MRRLVLLIVLLCGCSTAPVADVMDFFCPPRMPSAGGRGGVCEPAAPSPSPPPAVLGRPGPTEPPPPEPFVR